MPAFSFLYALNAGAMHSGVSFAGEFTNLLTS
jgi:hypothetical protein